MKIAEVKERKLKGERSLSIQDYLGGQFYGVQEYLGGMVNAGLTFTENPIKIKPKRHSF